MVLKALFLLALGTMLAAQPASPRAADPLTEVLAQGLQREMAHLKAQEVAPYHLALRVDEIQEVSISTTFGAVTEELQTRSRMLNVQVRVGDPSLDNTRQMRGDVRGNTPVQSHWVALPLDDKPEAIAAILWQAVDGAYKASLEDLAKVQANTAVKVDREDASADFSVEPVVTVQEEPALGPQAFQVDRPAWVARLKGISGAFRANPRLYHGVANAKFTLTRRYLVTSEGARVVQNFPCVAVHLYAALKAPDGMDLPMIRSHYAALPSGLPSLENLVAQARELALKLDQLSRAPVVEPFSGPAILSGRAAGVFFHEIFGHRVEGQRQKDVEEGQTFRDKVGTTVLPPFISVVSDPTLRTYGGVDLNGHYRVDDEGVKAAPVPLVRQGILAGFLMSRSPIQGFPVSNGHGRGEMGYVPMSRQSNLIVSTTKPVPMNELRALLQAECRKQGKPFGLRFEDVTGGFTLTGRTLPNAFNVTPLEVYRVFLDGRPDELVRGVDLVGTPLVMFSHIRETGAEVGVFNGVCGAESGWVPVACASPALLVTQVEVQKQGKAQDKPPLLARPCPR